MSSSLPWLFLGVETLADRGRWGRPVHCEFRVGGRWPIGLTIAPVSTRVRANGREHGSCRHHAKRNRRIAAHASGRCNNYMRAAGRLTGGRLVSSSALPDHLVRAQPMAAERKGGNRSGRPCVRSAREPCVARAPRASTAAAMNRRRAFTGSPCFRREQRGPPARTAFRRSVSTRGRLRLRPSSEPDYRRRLSVRIDRAARTPSSASMPHVDNVGMGRAAPATEAGIVRRKLS